MTQPEMNDVFRFMELRAPFAPDAEALRQNYIRDDTVEREGNPTRTDADLQSAQSQSAVGRLVYEHVFCVAGSDDPAEDLQRLMNALLRLLDPYRPRCAEDDDLGAPASETDPRVPAALQLFELERSPHIVVGDVYYMLPERLERIGGLPLFPALYRASELMAGARTKVDLAKLVKDLEAVFGGKALREVVFHDGAYSNDFRNAKRRLFDTLYLLYLLRGRAPVNLEHVIEGLRVLHVVEALAVDGLIDAVHAGPLAPSDQLLLTTLEVLFPQLQGWNGVDPLTALPLIGSLADFEAYYTAAPSIHPIFARLHWYKRPFNDIKPIGIGDLKVVKQWLTTYLPGEIAHIENVLASETKDRTHRRLERTEESFSFSSDSKESSQQDTQSTDRLELKREVDSVVKSDTNVGVNTSSSFSGTYYAGMVVITANVGATFGYKRDTSDQSKTSNMFSRETVSKAVEQVERNVSERRSVTKLFETEETTKHGFVNDKAGASHITGIYRWLDKKYKAQLFNYGKRMMFEFVIPEPAAFLVESRIRAFEAAFECPQPPNTSNFPHKTVEVLASTGVALTPELITLDEFRKLRLKYDFLSELTFPGHKLVSLLDPATGDSYFERVGDASDNDNWSADTYQCTLRAPGYMLTSVALEGMLGFQDTGTATNPDTGTGGSQNTLVIMVDGWEIFRDTSADKSMQYTGGFVNVPPTRPFAGDVVDVTIGAWDRQYSRLSIVATLNPSGATVIDWQTKVLGLVLAHEQKRVDKENQETQLAYDTQMSTYRSRLDQLKAQTINDLLQGQSEAFNREIICTELKKHCITMLTREFDSNPWNDLYSRRDLIATNGFEAPFQKFQITEAEAKTTAAFKRVNVNAQYPLIELQESAAKGRFVQFLEQAFEWRQLSYMFYPYFWASMPKWIDMMNRGDDTDPNMTAFLQAGSVRVLIAVTPAHDEAVLHFLATREPWEGGPAPVIGDPLFIPLHEELRKQQDDLYNAVPEGTPWTFVLPTSLVYLDGGGATLPTFPDVPV